MRVSGFQRVLATFFGIGRIPLAPGTWGSLAGLAAGYAMVAALASIGIRTAIDVGPDLAGHQLRIDLALLSLAAVAGILMIWSGDAAEKAWGRDPGRVVLDEVSGMLLLMAFLGLEGVVGSDTGALAAGFLLFRFLDIVKPMGIHRLQKLKGGLGILADDVAAAILGSAAYHLASVLLAVVG